ncbi:MAG: transcriptional regulator [Thalassobius sp.]|nr:transcriptional regulator [Thalassovita sp.]
MNRDIIDINDFTILVEEAKSDKPSVDACFFDEPVIAVAFYGSGNVELTVKYGDKEKTFNHTSGMVLSFYADENVEFIHTVSADKPLESLLIATAVKNLQKLPNQEGEIFKQMLSELVNPSDHYVEGPMFYMTPEMQKSVEQVFNNQYEGKTKMMFFRSQMTTLLSHFFGQLALMQHNEVNNLERQKLDQAREILLNNLENPPSLNELSREIGLNTFKLKKGFKEYFGLPVFKYLQNERLVKAHDLIKNHHLSIQETAWNVGYDSLSSFSNAFEKRFGYRPSQVK